MSHLQLAEIFEQTLEIAPLYTDSIVKIEPQKISFTYNSSNPQVEITQNDYIEECKGRSLLVFHGDCSNPGGAVKKGVSSIEADLCRRTNLFNALSKLDYPVNCGGVYLPKISVCRDLDNKICDNFSINILIIYSNDFSETVEIMLDTSEKENISNLIFVPSNRKYTDSEIRSLKNYLDIISFKNLKRVVISCSKSSHAYRSFKKFF